MNDQNIARSLKTGLLVISLMMGFSLPPNFYAAFAVDRFVGWPSYLGSRWFSAMGDRMQLNYGCAPTAMLRNIEGFAFWHAVLMLLIAAAAIVYASKEAGISLCVALLCVVALIPVSGGLIYFDAVLSVFPPPFICRTTSFDASQAALADEIVRHLCNQVGMMIALPVVVLGLAMLTYRIVRRRRLQHASAP